MTKDNIFKETNSISTQENKIKSISFLVSKEALYQKKLNDFKNDLKRKLNQISENYQKKLNQIKSNYEKIKKAY